ncbi:MAG: extracellular solute-binding protein [Eubacteriales bacterium]|nr:extracellular solute-binding protein [Eubacteriales bacterium]
MMQFKKAARKSLVFLLAFAMLLPGIVSFAASAEEDKWVPKSELVDSISDVKKLLSSETYKTYRSIYKDMPNAKNDIVIDAKNYDEATTDASVYIVNGYQGSTGDTLIAADNGAVSWVVDIPQDGMYSIRLEYFTQVQYKDGDVQVQSKDSSIERMLLVDDKVLFGEARSLVFSKTYVDKYIVDGKEVLSNSEEFRSLISGDNEAARIFQRDLKDNELRPEKVAFGEWKTVDIKDSSSYYNQPFEIYLAAGQHTIALDAIREPIAIKSLTLFVPEALKSYEEYLEEHSGASDVTGVEPIYIQAEYAAATSDKTIYQITDRTSAITQPSDTTRIRLNTIGGDKWMYSGSWISWTVDIPESGFYNIIPRSKQSYYSGVYVSRELLIDGVIPFNEASFLRFTFSDGFQAKPLTNGTDNYKIYLEKGIRTITMRVVLGDMAEVLADIQNSLKKINEYRRQLLMVTGPDPDEYRDYQFDKTMPAVMKGLLQESANLYAHSDALEKIIGSKGDHTVILDKVAFILERMGKYPSKVASLMDDLRDQSGSLGTWLMTTQNQPLLLDYICIQPVADKAPRAEASFFQQMMNEFYAFIQSFWSDYNSIGAISEEDVDPNKKIDVWVTTGRDQAQIIRSLIDDNFTTQTGISVNLKLVVGGTLLPATLAGTGPDLSMGNGQGDAINYAIRSAVLKLNDYDTFDDVTQRFTESAMTPLTLYGDTYGIPENMSFSMMFYRKDILAELDIDVPETWDDFYDAIATLQRKKLDIGFPSGLAGTLMLMYQEGEPLYERALLDENGNEIPKTEGMKVNLGSDVALAKFKEVSQLFTMYDFPVAYDFANRFRSGEMPLAIADYSTYNTLVIFAPEIKGMWGFTTLPGVAQEDGSINYTSVGGVSCILMMRTVKEERKEYAWDYIDWWTSAQAQSKYANEMEALLGPSAKQPTANREALYEMPWSAEEYKNLDAQFKQVTCTPEFPGGYIIGRYAGFAFLNVYNSKAEPINAMREYIDEMNKELTRKRKEFGLPTADDF